MTALVIPQKLFRRFSRILFKWFSVLTFFALAPASILGQPCPITNAIKWLQGPDRKGLDILAGSVPSPAAMPALILADDFLCRRTGPITDIHIWASWLQNSPNPNLPITLGIWSDVPAVGTPFSHPGVLLWSQRFGPGQYESCAVQSGDEQFYNPDPPPGQIIGPDTLIWQYNFYPTNPFTQQGTAAAPIVYWLSMTAGTNTAFFGWKTYTNQWNDGAVFGHLLPDGVTAIGDWQGLNDPRTPGLAKKLDLAFALTMPAQPPPPPPPLTNKWLQLPDTNGLDVNATFPNIVADDFWCTNAGTLTNIQIWASWQDDATPNPNMTFVLGIWSDVPAGSATGTATGPSHPGQLLWSEKFVPGSFLPPVFAGTGNEKFYDPTSGQLINETKIWRYSFNPKSPFCQKGSPNAPITYWLSVYAQNPNGSVPFGWKTSTNHWNDDAVYGHLNAAGTPLGDWKDLHDPRTPANLVSLDMAFLINNGPPSADCDPHQRPKWVQWPDTSTNGLDVSAVLPKVLGDDFLCRVTEPINGITVWGSWLNDKVDTNAHFQLGLWSDVPATAANPVSHPGQLLCSTIFFQPQLKGTSVQRYKYGLAAANLTETFYDPDLPGVSGFIGSDTQIWRYDFYPFYPGCWFQRGGDPATGVGPGRVYWVSLSAITDTNNFLFGWKTTTNHWNDDGVVGHLDSTGNPLNDWKDLHDPRSGKSLDLSFALRAFPITGINKDLKNTLQQPANGIRIVLSGIHEITWHYDDAPSPWPNFAVTFVAGNTVLEWSDPTLAKTVAPNQISHVGFEMAGSGAPPIIGIYWLSGGGVIGNAVQVCFHFLGNATTLVVNNCLLTAPVLIGTAKAEFYDIPPGLDQMLPNGQRSPLTTFDLPVQSSALMPGSSMRIPIPVGPSNAQYAMITMNLMDAAGGLSTMDFVLVPLDAALRPFIHSAELDGGNLNLHWFTLPDRIYRIQFARDLLSGFSDVSDDIVGTGEEMVVPFPLGTGQGYYRLTLSPE